MVHHIDTLGVNIARHLLLTTIIFFSFLTPSFVFAKEGVPGLIIVSPKEEETIFGDNVTFSFVVSNFILGIDGYLRASLDEKEVVIIKEQKTYSFTDLTQEKHSLVTELLDKKRQPLSPPVKKEVTFFSLLPKEKEAVVLQISPVTRDKTKNLVLFSLGSLALGGAVFLFLAFKFYINSKTGQNRSHQKPLG